MSRKVNNITITPSSSLQKFGILIWVALCPHMCNEYHKGIRIYPTSSEPSREALSGILHGGIP